MPSAKNLKIMAVAKTFSKLLRKELGRDMATVVRRNRKETSEGVCHSHDFCDANMTMAEAMKKHGLRDSNTEVWNKAWDYAKSQEFFVEKG